MVGDAIAETPFPDTVTCRVKLACSPVEAGHHVPAATMMLEPLSDGSLLTAYRLSEQLGRLALYLLAFPFEIKVLEPLELHDAFRAVAARAMRPVDL